jgi:ABC-2 type transport system permease protein
MKTFLTLLHREWLQHRFAWAMLMLVPMGLAALLLSFGHIEIDRETAANAGPALATVVAFVSICATALISCALLWLAAVFLMTGLARRDHADRSIEFWLSLPTSHSQSLAAPLLMHLIVVPAAALLIGLAGGYVISLVVVSRVVGLSEWLALPWAELLTATLALAGRVLVGLPLATLWLLPLILLVLLLTALFRRWGLVVLAAAFGLGSLFVQQWLGYPLLTSLLSEQVRQAGRALITGASYKLQVQHPGDVLSGLQEIPPWAAADVASALRALASPMLVGSLALAALLFALLVQWRRRAA